MRNILDLEAFPWVFMGYRLQIPEEPKKSVQRVARKKKVFRHSSGYGETLTNDRFG